MSEEKKMIINEKDFVACNYFEACDYFKQLKRLQEENEELKKLKCKFKEYCTCDIEKYRSALEEIREIAKFNQFYNTEKLLINGDIGQIQDLKMTEIFKKCNEVLK